jgi:hypothetical protein
VHAESYRGGYEADMETKDPLIHELNNPLGAVLANLEFSRGELAGMKALDPARVKAIDAALRDAVLATERAMRVVERMRTK